MHPFAIATAGDSAYFPLLQGLVRSIRAFPQGAGVPITVLDLGFGTEERRWLTSEGARLAAPGWDHPFDRPMPERFKAMVSRPHLPSHVPDAAVILWLDADCWVQDWSAIDLLLAGAAATGFAIVPELDRAYTPFHDGAPHAHHLHDWYKACFDEATARRLFAHPLLNGGVFAARRDAPHWALWARLLTDSLRRTVLFVSGQIALNLALRAGGLPFSQLPARCNWICFRATPFSSGDGRLLLEPELPHAPLGILHLAGYPLPRKQDPHTLSTPGGGTVVRPLSHRPPDAPPASGPAERPEDALGRAFALYQQGKAEESGTLCRAILAASPDQPAAAFLLGAVDFALGRPEESRRCFALAIALQPDLADAFNNLALLEHQARPRRAATLTRRALRLQPEALIFTRLGTLLRDERRDGEALEAHGRALALQPDSADAWHERAHSLRAANRPAQAVRGYDHAHRLAPERTEFLCDRLFASLSLCDWRNHAETCRRLVETIDRDQGVVLPLLSLLIGTSPAQQDRAARRFHRTAVGRALAVPLPRRPAASGGRLNIAYLSADFQEHATAYLTAELFELHDRTRFGVFGYSYGEDDGGRMRRRLEAGFDRFRDLRHAGPDEVAALCAEDDVHILVDLKGYTRDARPTLLARRLAPVQVAYLGYPGTLGADLLDYAIGDRFVTPPEHQPFYRERLVRMPDSYQVNDRRRPADAPVPTRAACGLPAEGVVFCAFHTAFKIAPALFGLWMRILGRVPGSTLWLLEAGRDAAANLRMEAARHGVEPSRLVFAPHRPQAEHLARYRLADLALDSFPYTGHTTTSDALWMGLPVLTTRGETFASSVAASLLHAAGLPETVTRSFAEYEERAVRLAGEPATLAAYRRRLETGRATAPLFDSPRFTRNLERAYRAMWDRHAAGLPPEAFTVEPS
ncbi:putative O-linked N-acetylglucosamine transferase (SPINDLY family) [Azospirillum agricola]|uniref:O-linked N-acetylglucosamine transferase, SPINDLY family protein n=1 Tax=Azospirillum agricola TaxID=1720247 RepID=UPI002D80545E|nr:glycosyltransferase [Azospirillum agricola]MBP2228902.1 putative O-linked N-acetylglucosamine transferase (SPINDLY family) [Azospirillum agricola]